MALANLSSYTNGNFVTNEIALALEKRLTDRLGDWTWDVSGETSTPGSTVTVHYVSTTPSAATKSVSGSYTSDNFALTAIPLTFSDIDYVQVEVAEQDFLTAGMEGKLKNAVVDTVVKQLAKKIEDRAMALMTAGNYSNNTIVGGVSGYGLAALRNNIGQGFIDGFDEPICMLTSPYLAKVEADPGYYARTSNGNFDDGSSVIRSDRMISAGNLIGAVFDKSAIVIGARRFAPDSGLGYGAVDTKVLENGVEIRFSIIKDSLTSGKTFFRAEVLMQAVRGNPNALRRLTSA